MNSLFRIARRHSARSDHAKYWHCALLIKHRRVIGIGVNTGWRHAEESLIGQTRPAALRGAWLLSLRFNGAGELRIAKPCAKCAQLIRSAGIRRVRYSDALGIVQEYVN